MGKNKKINSRLIKKFKVLIIILISCLLILEALPTVYSNPRSTVSKSIGDFGVLRALDEVLTDKESKLNSHEIKNETQQRLEEMELLEIENKSGDFNYQIKTIQNTDPRKFEPIIISELTENPEVDIINHTTLLEFLIDQPLNYYIFTKVNNTKTWTKGLLRRSLVFPKFNPTKWEYIDADGNRSNGNELRVRFDIVLDTENWERPRLFPREARVLKIRGGFGLTIERTTIRQFPLEVYIVKSISYEGENYLWTTGAYFDTAPSAYSSVLMAETIELKGLAETLITTLLGGGIGNLTSTTLAEINGPYSLRFESQTNLKKFNLIVGMVKYENRTLTDKNWLIFHTTPAKGFEYVTRSGEVWVDSSNIQAPIDQLKWTSGYYDNTGQNKIPIDVRIRYGEERKDFIFADVELVDVPKWFSIKIDYTKVVDNRNVTVVDYSADDILKILNYTSYYYPYYNSQLTILKFNCTHVLLEDVPKNFHMEMTSDIGRDINTTPYNNPQLGIAANIIDNLIVRVANRFYRIGKYLKLLAEGLLELPTNEGWAVIDMGETQLTTLEFFQSSSTYILYPGNYIGFLNTSALIPTENQKNGNNEYNSSTNQITSTNQSAEAEFALSARLSGLSWVNMSFSTPLELELRTNNGNSFVALLVDNDNFASAYISNIPEYLKVTNLETSSLYTTIDPEVDYGDTEGTIIDQFIFKSQFRRQIIQLTIDDIPNGIEFSR
ncbi:hypothetical protein, partial [[Eubacterium] cellulosolvens]